MKCRPGWTRSAPASSLKRFTEVLSATITSPGLAPRRRAVMDFRDAPGFVERGEWMAAEIARRQIGGAELQVGIVGAALAGRVCRPTVQLVVSLVPRTERVADAKPQPPLDGIAAARQRPRDVDQPQPDAILDARPRLTRVGQQEAQRLIDRSHLRGDAGDHVHLEDVPPEGRISVSGGSDQRL